MSESGEKKDVTAAKASEHASARKPYSPPNLVRLGSVRELTLGATGGFQDGLPGQRQHEQ